MPPREPNNGLFGIFKNYGNMTAVGVISCILVARTWFDMRAADRVAEQAGKSAEVIVGLNYEIRGAVGYARDAFGELKTIRVEQSRMADRLDNSITENRKSLEYLGTSMRELAAKIEKQHEQVDRP